jgi:aryl-alcohol dehydrogenase-like predicted oxidoreductase
VEQRQLGKSGLFVSAVGLGCNNFGGRVDDAGTARVVAAALDAGINFFDTADVYGNLRSEVLLGKALGARRADVVVASKFGIATGPGKLQRGGSRRYIVRALEASLERLGTDYIDLYQLHVPDRHTPLEETLRALDDLVRAGKIRYVGHSNFAGWQIADAHWIARTLGVSRFVTAQNHYNLLERSAATEVLAACDAFGLGLLPYFPLASGLLSGKYHRGEAPPQGARLATMENLASRTLTDENFAVVERLTAYAGERGQSLLSLAFGWLLSQPAVTSVIAGATQPEQVAANVAAGEDWRLSAQEMSEVETLLTVNPE